MTSPVIPNPVFPSSSFIIHTCPERKRWVIYLSSFILHLSSFMSPVISVENLSKAFPSTTLRTSLRLRSPGEHWDFAGRAAWARSAPRRERAHSLRPECCARANCRRLLARPGTLVGQGSSVRHEFHELREGLNTCHEFTLKGTMSRIGRMEKNNSRNSSNSWQKKFIPGD